MRIAVFIKQVPDPWRVPSLTAQGTLARSALPELMNEHDEYALEAALQLAEKHGGDVTVVTMGPASAVLTLTKALSMGANTAIHLLDDTLAGSDALATSLALAAIVRDRAYELLVFGTASTDASMGVIPAMMAERLGVAQLTMAHRVEVAGDRVRIERVTESGSQTVEGHLPAVVSIVAGSNEPRFPSFRGIQAARAKPVLTVSVQESGLNPDRVGHPGSSTTVVDATARTSRPNGTVVLASAESGVDIADYLAEQGFLPRRTTQHTRGSI